jgi:ATP-dependent exoDNAse (exonuclease V) beta subunit
MQLTLRQRAAVERTGQDVCVVAGPGSGKTRVLIERFRRLVETGTSPLAILAITFTEKAATEIKTRLVEAFAGRPDLRAPIERAYVSTIHGFCARLLKENAIAAGLDPEFRVLDEADSQAELQQAAHVALDQLYDTRTAEFTGLLDAICAPAELAESLLGLYEALRTAGRSTADLRQESSIPPAGFREAVETVRAALRAAGPGTTHKRRERIDAMRDWAGRAALIAGRAAGPEHFRALEEFQFDLRSAERPVSECIRWFREQRPAIAGALVAEHYAAFRALLVDAIEEIDRRYRARKLELSALDFSDLEERAIALLERKPALRFRVRRSIAQILMDELQDTNRLQWKLLGLIRTDGHFFAVGDMNQSIFGFRHADPELFRGYRDRVASAGGEVDRLFENHRSREPILEAVNLVFQGAEGIEPHRLTASREFGWKPEPSVEVLVASGDGGEDAVALEARWVARRIRELAGSLPVEIRACDGGIERRAARFQDIAVLLRALTAATAFEDAFREFGVPCLTFGGRYFYEEREPLDILQLLRVIDNPRDEVALAGLLRSPMVGVSDESLLRLRLCSKNLGRALAGLNGRPAPDFDPDDLDRLQRFGNLLRDLRARRDDLPPDRLLARVLDETAYAEGLDARACSNLDKLLGQVRDWRQRRGGSLRGLIADLEWRRRMEREPVAPPSDSSDVVRLMSIHQAKGLQFPIVFLSALHRGVSRDKPPISLSPSGAIGARWRNPVSGEDLSDWAHLEYCDHQERKEKEEENRLLYVAMTRAEEHLVLSFANTGHAMRNWAGKVVSAFGFDPESRDEQSGFHHPPSAKFPIRLWRTSTRPQVPAPPETAPAVHTAVLLPRPLLAGQHDSAVSVTSVALFETCPRRYYLARYLSAVQAISPAKSASETARLSTPPVGQALSLARVEPPDAAEIGLQVHSLLAGEPCEEAGPEARELEARFWDSDLGARAARAERIEREFDFLMDLDDVVLQGQIDLWFEEGGQLVLVDCKTDDIAADAAAERAEAYGIQLRLYALALERVAGRPPDAAWLSFLRPNVAVRVSLDPPHMQAARATLRALRDAQNTMRFPLRTGEQCLGCPFYRGLCPAGSGAW